jgi:raffinose/stachyose/melibiose transport system substrate-binding protein
MTAHEDRANEGMSKPGRALSRRAFLRGLGASAGAAILAACGSAATQTAAPATTRPAATEPAAEPAATKPAAAAPVTVSLLTSQNQNDQLMINALTDAYTALHPNVTFDIEIPPGSSADVPNLVQTRLATGEMNDIFYFNSGSLIQPLHPSDTLVDLSKEPFIANIADSFLPTVSQNGGIYGVPVGYAASGGVLYNKKIFEKVGVSVPKTWAEFEANNEKIKAAGIPPVLQTYGDVWTSQLFVLGDFYNVAKANPNFAEDYTNNKAKFATTPEAVAGFEYLQEGFEKGWYQKDYATTKFEQGLKMLANGEAAQYPMLTQVMNTVATNYPDQVKDIGFFALPGKDASKNGATVWMPLAFFIPKTSKHIDVAKDFFAFVASTAGTDAITAKVAPAGPYLIKGAKLPDNVLPFVKDLNGYIDSGNTYPALEFLSPVKGTILPQLCISVGTGQMTPEKAAAAYDEDVKKQAQQLGLPGW